LDKYRNGASGASVYALYKKGFGLFPEPLKYLWVGGNFNNSFNRWHKDNKVWGLATPSKALNFDSNAVIYDMYYKVGALLDTDVIYLAGKYTYTPTTGTACSNICEFDYKQETFSAVSSNQPTGSVFSVDYVTVHSRLVLGLEFDQPAKVVYTDDIKSTVALQAYGTETVIKTAVTRSAKSVSSCGTALCTVGSWGVSAYNTRSSFSGDEELGFYAYNLKQFQKLGEGTDGQARVIVPIIAGASSVMISFASILFVVIFALLF
jgi:hypothetical protein